MKPGSFIFYPALFFAALFCAAGNPDSDRNWNVKLGPGVSFEMVPIPPGKFSLGSSPSEREWAAGPEGNGSPEDFSREGDNPRAAVIQDQFWMARTEVTMLQWKVFIEETGYTTDGEKDGRIWGPGPDGKEWTFVEGKSWKDPNFDFIPGEDYPVAAISWNDATVFCQWLNRAVNAAGGLPAGYEFRLPTEAEWEYACRGGKGRAWFWWGDDWAAGVGRLNRRGSEDGFEYVSPVGRFGPAGENGYGLYDMLGNVYEWCLDGYDETGAHPEVFLESIAMRIIKGGTYRSPNGFQRPAYRSPWRPETACALIGFRPVLGKRQQR